MERELVSARRFLLSSSPRNQASFKHVKAAEKKPRIQARQSDFLLAIVKFRSFFQFQKKTIRQSVLVSGPLWLVMLSKKCPLI